MKNFKIILAAFVLLTTSGIASAQLKVAHINSADLMQDYKKVQEVEKILQQYREAYAKRINRLESEILEIQKTLRDSGNLISQAYSELLQQTYQEKYQEWERLQQEFQNKMVEKQSELLNPIIEELKGIISEVAKQKGYDYVLDSSEGGNLIYGNPGFDLMADVKKKLAEIAAKDAATQPGQGAGGGK